MGSSLQTHSLLRELQGGGLEIEQNDPLAELISDLEARLELIRETHLEQEMLEVDVVSREGELIVYRDTIAQRERTLSEDEHTLRDREQVVQRERDEFQRQRERIEDRLRELERLESRLGEQERDQAFESEDLQRERATIESLRVEIESERRELSTRERGLREREVEIESQRERLAQTQRAIEQDKARLEEQARAQQALASQLESMRSELAEREREIESRFAEHDQLRSMLSALTHQLDESRDQAKRHAEEYQKALSEKAEEARKSEDLERRCRTLETERTRIRGELTKVREELDAHELFKTARPAVSTLRRRLSPSRAAQIGGGIWFGSVAVAALGVGVSLGDASMGFALGSIGVSTALCLFAAHALVGRAWDSSMLLIAALGGCLGLWFPAWHEAASTAVSLWQLPPEVIPGSLVEQIPLAFSAATASFAIAISLFLLTGSTTVLGHALFATMIISGVLLVPEQSPRLQAIGAMLWIAIVAATLTKWGVQGSRQRSGVLA